MIAVAFALEFESAYFRARHDARLRLDIWLLGSMGAGVVPVLEKKLESVRPSLVISAGFGGGLQPELKVGDLVLGTNYSDPRIIEQLQVGSHWHKGEILTVDAIIEKAADKQRLAEESGRMVADMETMHMSRVCSERGIPLLSVRCISDDSSDDMPVPAPLLINPENGRPEPVKLFKFLLANPKATVGFNKLVKNSRIAQAGLSKGLDEILPQLLHIKL